MFCIMYSPGSHLVKQIEPRDRDMILDSRRSLGTDGEVIVCVGASKACWLRSASTSVTSRHHDTRCHSWQALSQTRHSCRAAADRFVPRFDRRRWLSLARRLGCKNVQQDTRSSTCGPTVGAGGLSRARRTLQQCARWQSWVDREVRCRHLVALPEPTWHVA